MIGDFGNYEERKEMLLTDSKANHTKIDEERKYKCNDESHISDHDKSLENEREEFEVNLVKA